MTRRSAWLLGLVGLGLPELGLAQETEKEAIEEEVGAEAEGEAEPTAEPTVDPELERLLNSLDRDWDLPTVRANTAKGGDLPLNVIVPPEPDADATEEDQAIVAIEEELTSSEPSDTVRAPTELPRGWGWSVTALGLAGIQVGAAFGTHWSDGDPEAGALGGSLGGIAGIAGGLGAAYGLQPDADEGSAMVAGSLVGSWTGYELSRLVLGPDAKDRTERALAWSALGNAVGVGTAIALQGNTPTYQTTTGALLGATVGWQIGAGIADFADLDPEDDRRPRAGLELGLGYAFGAGMGYAHYRGLPLTDPVWGTVLVAEGAWVGTWLPWALANQPTDRQRSGSMRLSVAAGYLASLGVSRVLEPDPRLMGLQALGFSVGTLVGAGIPLSTPIEGNPRQVVIPMLLGGVGGQILGTLVEPRYRLTENDVLMVTVLSAWTGYQMIGWGLMASELNLGERRATGVVLTTAGVGLAAAWGLPAVIEASPRQSVLIISSSLWGTWYGAWSGYLLQVSPAQIWSTTLTAGDVALLGMAGASAFGFDPSWRQVGLVNAAGAAGAGFGALVGVLASPDPRTVGFASLVGTTVGLAGGTVLAIVREPGESQASTLVLPGLKRPRLAKVPFTVLPMAAPFVGDDGDVGVMVQITALERKVSR